MRLNINPEIAGVAENEDLSGVQVYPNPVSENLTIDFVSKQSHDVQISILDMSGALISSEQKAAYAGEKFQINFDTKILAKGVYMIQMTTLNSILTQRFVKQ